MKKSLKRFWGAGDIGIGFIGRVEALFFIFFLTDVALLPMNYVGFLLIFISVVDFIIGPFSGGIIEGRKSMRWGRYRSYMLLCPPALLFVFPFLFIKAGSDIVNIIIIICAYLVYKTLFNIATISNSTIILTMTQNQQERALLASNRMTGAYAGVLIAGYVMPQLLNNCFIDYFGKDRAYMMLAFCAVCLFVIGFLFHFKLSAGFDVPDTVNRKNDKISFRQMITVILKTPALLPVMVADMASTCVYYILPALAVYYYNNVLQKPSLLAIHMLIIGICGVCGAYCSRFFVRKFQVRTACLIVYILISATLITTRFVAYIPAAFIIVNGIMQFFTSSTQSMESNLYMDATIYSEWKTGINAKAFIMSMFNMAARFAGIVKNFIIWLTFVAIGYKAGTTNETVKEGIINAYTLVPAVIPLIGWIALFFFYKLTPEKIKAMQSEINDRKM